MDRKSPELIEQDMHETRQALTDKVAALEQQVVGTIHEATTAVQDTVQSVKSAVEETVTNVKDTVSGSVASVKSTFDVPEHVRTHPWAGIGVAALAGAVTGYLLSSEEKTTYRPGQRFAGNGISNQSTSSFASSPRASTSTAQTHQSHEPGLFDEIWHRVRGEIKQLSEAAINTLSQSLRENLNQGIGHLVETAAAFAAGSAHGQQEEDRTTNRSDRHRAYDDAATGVRG